MEGKVSTAEMEIAQMAAASHGVVTRMELLAAGLSKASVDGRIAKGALIPVHRGVYRVGHRAPSVEARYLAAVRAGGDSAVLSGRAAGYLHGLLKGKPPPPEATTLTQRRIDGVATSCCRNLAQTDTTTVRGIPVTSVPRTLVDLAAVLGPNPLARACHEAEVRYRTTPANVEAVLERRPNSPGAAKLRKILRGEVRVTLSALERAFLRRLEDAGLPLPETNRPAGGRRVDCRWPDRRLTVELDSYRFHNSRHAWEMDRRREREARARGDEFRRFTYEDALKQPRYMLAELRALLR
jgi:predicted transcriptional regulator of viral defense system